MCLLAARIPAELEAVTVLRLAEHCTGFREDKNSQQPWLKRR